MDGETNGNDLRRIGPFKHIKSACSGATSTLMDDNIESGNFSLAGDIGDRALNCSRHSEGSSNHHFSFNHAEENVDVPIAPDALPQSSEIGPRDRSTFTTFAPVSPLLTDPILPHADKTQGDNRLPQPFEYISCLVHLAVFGIFGVMTRYLLQKLFGPGVAGVTSDLNILYLDLPSNMVGSFLMGWLGVVFKGNISVVSENLAIGLTTGYLGSLTTFSSWNQKMLELSANGQWAHSILGYVIGLFLAGFSIIAGIDTAESFQTLLKRQNTSLKGKRTSYGSFMQHWVVLIILVLILGLLWGLSVAFEKREFMHGGGGAHLLLACIVGPMGVWSRWLLARLNGCGLGRSGWLNWVPFGTLVANVVAACLMAALATTKKVYLVKQLCYLLRFFNLFNLKHEKRQYRRSTPKLVTQLQQAYNSFLGCLSTVSTFIAEFNTMRLSKHSWRAYAYAAITIIVSFILGTLIYSVPVWTKGYN